MMNNSSSFGQALDRARQVHQNFLTAHPQAQALRDQFSQSPMGQAFQQAMSQGQQNMQAMPGYDRLASSPMGSIFSRILGGS